MTTVVIVLQYVIFFLLLILIFRIVMDYVFLFARSYQPRGIFLVAVEAVYSVTDPPIKALRRIIPPLRLGDVSLDLSVLVLFALLVILQAVVGRL